MPMTYSDAAHLLRRTGFGPSPIDINALTGLTRAAAVELMLNVSAAPAVVSPTGIHDPNTGEWDKWVNTVKWWLERMRTTPAPLQEKIAMFWHHHFATGQDKVDDMDLMWDQNQIFRSLGLGSFRALTHAVVIHPAILLYLDNQTNRVGAPNENLARELMELFTLGVNQYTQNDVVEAARAWTGHGVVAYNDHTYKFWPGRHDDRNKTFFGTTKNWDGPDVIDEILRDNSAKQAIAARFVAKKIWGWFAYPNPPAAVLDAITAAFLASTDLDITALLRAIFNHDEFYSDTAKHGIVRTPVDFVVAALKYTGITADTANPQWWLDQMGMEPFNPPNVSGWRQNAYWISSAAFWARADFVDSIAWRENQDPTGLLSTLDSLGPAAAAQAAFDAFGINDPSPQTRASLENWMAAQRGALYESWVERSYLLGLAMLTPDFQLA